MASYDQTIESFSPPALYQPSLMVLAATGKGLEYTAETGALFPSEFQWHMSLQKICTYVEIWGKIR